MEQVRTPNCGDRAITVLLYKKQKKKTRKKKYVYVYQKLQMRELHLALAAPMGGGGRELGCLTQILGADLGVNQSLRRPCIGAAPLKQNWVSANQVCDIASCWTLQRPGV